DGLTSSSTTFVSRFSGSTPTTVAFPPHFLHSPSPPHQEHLSLIPARALAGAVKTPEMRSRLAPVPRQWRQRLGCSVYAHSGQGTRGIRHLLGLNEVNCDSEG